jgi:hypothetical protein
MDIISMTAITAAVISAVGLWIQTRQNNRALGVTILRDLEKDFLWSDEIRTKRLALATFLIGRKAGDPPSPEVSYMLDFFDSMGLYHNKGVIDTEMAWVMFYYWLGHYWQLLKEDIDAAEQDEDGILYYKNVKRFYKDLTEFGRKHRRLPPEEKYFSLENLRAFLVGEIKHCSPPEGRLPPEASTHN